MRFWMTAVATVLAVTVLILLFVRPFTAYVAGDGQLYIVNTFTGSVKVCGPGYRRCVPIKERR